MAIDPCCDDEQSTFGASSAQPLPGANQANPVTTQGGPDYEHYQYCNPLTDTLWRRVVKFDPDGTETEISNADLGLPCAVSADCVCETPLGVITDLSLLCGTTAPPTPPANQAPIFGANIGDQTATEAVAFDGLFGGNFSDPDGDALTYSAAPLPPGLSINPATGEISGTPTTPGTTAVTITATDPSGLSVSSNPFNITVDAPANNPPVFISGPIPDRQFTEGDLLSFITVIYFNHPDGDTLTYSATGFPAGIVIDSFDGDISGTALTPGVYPIVVTVTDSDGQTASSNTFTYTVNIGVFEVSPVAIDTAVSPATITVEFTHPPDPASLPTIPTNSSGEATRLSSWVDIGGNQWQSTLVQPALVPVPITITSGDVIGVDFSGVTRLSDTASVVGTSNLAFTAP